MARYHGRKGVVYMGAAAGDVAGATVALNHWTLDMKSDRVDVTAFGDPNKVYVQGLPDISGEIGGFWDDTDDTLYEAARSEGGINLYLYPSADAPSKYFFGTAWVDFGIDTDVSGAVGVSGSFAAAGPWGAN